MDASVKMFVLRIVCFNLGFRITILEKSKKQTLATTKIGQIFSKVKFSKLETMNKICRGKLYFQSSPKHI